MKRSGFKPAWSPKTPKQIDYIPRPRLPALLVKPLPGRAPVPKDDPARDEAYRRMVAALPCIHCNVAGYSQAAHGPTLGGGIKASDHEIFPLCCDRPDVVGCHSKFDQYKLFDRMGRHAMAARWAEQTRKKLEQKALDDTT